jgi:hypothetical protein
MRRLARVSLKSHERVSFAMIKTLTQQGMCVLRVCVWVSHKEASAVKVAPAVRGALAVKGAQVVQGALAVKVVQVVKVAQVVSL